MPRRTRKRHIRGPPPDWKPTFKWKATVIFEKTSEERKTEIFGANNMTDVYDGIRYYRGVWLGFPLKKVEVERSV